MTKPLWTPVLDWNLSAQKCRKLNELADLAAAQITDAKRDDFFVLQEHSH